MIRELTVRGQMSHLNMDIQSARNQAAASVINKPPKNPSQVFLGESLISGVRPTKMPAQIHLQVLLAPTLLLDIYTFIFTLHWLVCLESMHRITFMCLEDYRIGNTHWIRSSKSTEQ